MAVYLAEFIGTFTLIFIGAGSICVDALTGGKVGLVGIALAHGLAIMVMVYALGHISGAHFNPAVTAAMWITKRVKSNRALGYVAAQLAGAGVASLALKALVPHLAALPPYLGACDLTGVTPLGGILLEAALTFFLVTVIWGTAVDSRASKSVAGLAIGLTITMNIFLGGYFTGAAMNPARAFGPAMVSGHTAHHIVYWIGPILGGVLAGLLYESFFLKKQS